MLGAEVEEARVSRSRVVRHHMGLDDGFGRLFVACRVDDFANCGTCTLQDYHAIRLMDVKRVSLLRQLTSGVVALSASNSSASLSMLSPMCTKQDFCPGNNCKETRRNGHRCHFTVGLWQCGCVQVVGGHHLASDLALTLFCHLHCCVGRTATSGAIKGSEQVREYCSTCGMATRAFLHVLWTQTTILFPPEFRQRCAPC